MDILKKDYTGLVIPFVGSGDPFRYTYKNENDDKFNQITTSEATISIISNPNISLDTFYTEDERTWMVRYYAGEFVANNWDDTRAWDDYMAWEEFTPNKDGRELKWAGFLLPDASSEPFRNVYQFEIKAKDVIGTLKDVPYAKDTVLIKKVDSLKNILGECLRRTDLDINFVIGVNTFEYSMDASTNLSCPLEQTYIDTNRFIDTNNKPYSVYNVIKHICDQFSANVQQANGKWYFIDITERARNSFYAREYKYTALTESFDKVGALQIISNKMLTPEQLVNADHSFTKEPAYRSVSTYYQYGYLSNQLPNGDFNVINPAPLINPFPGWTLHGGIQVGYGQKLILTGQGDKLINDYYMLVNNSDLTKWIESDPVTVLMTNLIALSIFFRFNNNSGGSVNVSKKRLNVALRLTAIGKETMYWSKDKSAWQTLPEIITFEANFQDFIKGTTASISATYPKYDGLLSVLIYGVTGEDAIIDDVKITFDESEYYRSPIGFVDQLVNVFDYSKSPDPTVLLFGDDNQKTRTSWMRRLKNGEFVPTVEWYKKANGTGTRLPLQYIVSRNILGQHRAASRRFEGTIRGAFTPLDTISIPLTLGRFMFLSGTFSAKKSTVDITAIELFSGEFTQFNESTFEDFGDFKDAKGSQIGSSTGVSIPVNSVGGSTGAIPLEAASEDMLALMVRDRFVSPYMFYTGWLGIKNGEQYIEGYWDFLNRPTIGGKDIATINDLLTLRDVFNRATGQNQDAKLVLDVIDGKNVVSWEDVEAEPTVTTLKAKFPYNVGVAFKDALLNDTQYGGIVKTEFDQMTPENGCKFGKIRPNRATFNFNELNDNFNWAQANGLKVHLHYLLPGGDDKTIQWFLDMESLPNAAVEVEAEIRLHIKTVLQHVMSTYPGMVVSIDIVNECLTGGGNVKDSMLKRLFGEQYIDIVIDECNKWAPGIPKLLNDFSFEYTSSKIEGLIALRNRIASRGYILDGMGSQMHSVLRVMTETPESLQDFRDRIQLIADSGMMLHISELDVKCRKGTDGVDLGPYPFMNPQLEAAQANFFVQVYKAVWEIMPPGKLLAVTVWSLDDNSNFENIPTMTDYTSIWYLENGVYKKRLAHQALLDMQIN